MPASHTPRKRFGQNFLQDQGVITNIIAALQPQPQQHLIEIGPGLGALTLPLLKTIGKLQVIELDRDLVPKLQRQCASVGELLVYEGDVLQVDFREFSQTRKSLRLVGNLPYNISTPLLFHCITHQALIQDMHFMLQKEVVDRITAPVGSKDYGRLSVMMQYYCYTEALFTVPPEAFLPPPKVTSAVVRLVPHATPPYTAQDPEKFAALVKQAFNQRRKTLKKSLQPMITAEQMQMVGVDPGTRPQNLSVANFVDLANQCLP